MTHDFDRGLGGVRALEGLKTRNIVVGSKRTSIRLEQSMWDMLEEIANQEEVSLQELFTSLAERLYGTSGPAVPNATKTGRKNAGSDVVTFSSAVRVYICSYYRQRASESGHRRAGHGNGNPFAGTPLDAAEAERARAAMPENGKEP